MTLFCRLCAVSSRFAPFTSVHFTNRSAAAAAAWKQGGKVVHSAKNNHTHTKKILEEMWKVCGRLV